MNFLFDVVVKCIFIFIKLKNTNWCVKRQTPYPEGLKTTRVSATQCPL